MVLDLHKLRVYSLRIQTQRHKSINRRRFGNELESPRLLIFELDDFVVAADDLVALVLGPVHVVSILTSISSTISTQTAFQDLRFEQLRQSKPLARHLVAIIGVDKLVVVDTVGRVAFHTFDRWLAGVEGDDIVDESLTGGREGKALAWVGSVVFGSGGLANFELLSRCGGHFEGGGGGEVVEGLWWFLGDESWFDRRAGECSCWAMQSREHVWI
jgi:hypothetical protein